MEPLVFDLKPTVIPVTIGGKKYELREASEEAGSTFEAARLQSFVIADGKIAGYSAKAANIRAQLVSDCLFDENNSNPPVLTVKRWPLQVTKRLFEEAKRISGLSDKEETIESLTAQIKLLQQKRHALLTMGQDDPKEASSSDSTDTSDSPPSSASPSTN